ncbi:unnamed protein product [Polarella glacialis]|uniref:Uncharacterized protein n=1 Tax=Polarella glacialis TaxID=89957 RepID=A0A813KQP2_POLGL|nr:unnamed protein product [Polarella glacialis]CAE8710797.1 unnamed protein product [Polarella glacialis]
MANLNEFASAEEALGQQEEEKEHIGDGRDYAEDMEEDAVIFAVESGYFPSVFGIQLSAQSRSSEVVWIRATDAGALAAFPGKALLGRRVSHAGLLFARAGGDGMGCPRYEEEDADTETVVDYALLTRGVMDLSMALDLAQEDPNFLRFTDRHGTTVWPTRDSLLSGSDSADFQMAPSAPAPARQKAAARAAAAPLPRASLRPQAPANGARPKVRAVPARGPSFGAGLDGEAVDSGLSPEDLAALAKILQGVKMKNGNDKSRYCQNRRWWKLPGKRRRCSSSPNPLQ